MNYARIYEQLIARAKNEEEKRKSEHEDRIRYYEKHHIIPKCMKGPDVPENFAYLTAKEHFIAHLLLVRIYPKSNKLWHAMWSMVIRKNPMNDAEHEVRISAKMYDEIKSFRTFDDDHLEKLRKSAQARIAREGIYNKGKSWEEIVGVERAKEMLHRSGTKHSEGIRSGKTWHNKGKKIEEFIDPKRVSELKKISSETAKKTFTGRKQSPEQIQKRMEARKRTIANRTPEQKQKASENAKKAAAKANENRWSKRKIQLST